MNLLKSKIKGDLKKSLEHLEYSFNKVKKMNLDKASWTEEELEVTESFSARFARASDICISQFLRLMARENDPAFNGSVIDLLNFSEKRDLIESAKIWIRIRELRNAAAHEYSTENISALVRELVSLTPHILKMKSQL